MGTMSRNDAEKLVGKKTALPGAGKEPGPNWTPSAASAPSGRNGVGALPADPVRNPKAIIADRENKAGMACGGKVKKMATGGIIRGAGAATKGKRFNNGIC